MSKSQPRTTAIGRSRATDCGAEQRGSILLMALLVTLLILGLGLTALWLSSNQTRTSGNITRRHEALYSAEAALARARNYLTNNPDQWQAILQGCDPKGTKDGRGVVFCMGSVPLKNIALLEGQGTSKQVRASQAVYTIYVRNDDAEHAHCDGIGDNGDCDGDGDNDSADQAIRETDNDGRLVLRAEGRGRDGLSYYGIEQVVSRRSEAKGKSQSTQEGGSQFGQYSATVNIAPPGS
ncbi:MAG: hypothetical protein H6707_02410 [Deltaproteobacteria bacterium]|nr:hypothetical protein [Deltaproteobacteria bacterium]